jgi:hypothetical protein
MGSLVFHRPHSGFQEVCVKRVGVADAVAEDVNPEVEAIAGAEVVDGWRFGLLGVCHFGLRW